MIWIVVQCDCRRGRWQWERRVVAHTRLVVIVRFVRCSTWRLLWILRCFRLDFAVRCFIALWWMPLLTAHNSSMRAKNKNVKCQYRAIECKLMPIQNFVFSFIFWHFKRFWWIHDFFLNEKWKFKLAVSNSTKKKPCLKSRWILKRVWIEKWTRSSTVSCQMTWFVVFFFKLSLTQNRKQIWNYATAFLLTPSKAKIPIDAWYGRCLVHRTYSFLYESFTYFPGEHIRIACFQICYVIDDGRGGNFGLWTADQARFYGARCVIP